MTPCYYHLVIIWAEAPEGLEMKMGKCQLACYDDRTPDRPWWRRPCSASHERHDVFWWGAPFFHDANNRLIDTNCDAFMFPILAPDMSHHSDQVYLSADDISNWHKAIPVPNPTGGAASIKSQGSTPAHHRGKFCHSSNWADESKPQVWTNASSRKRPWRESNCCFRERLQFLDWEGPLWSVIPRNSGPVIFSLERATPREWKSKAESWQGGREVYLSQKLFLLLRVIT